MRGMYVQALEVVKSRKQLQKIVDSKNKEITLKRIEKILTEACKIQQATELIKKGNTQTEVVCEVTGLSRDEVNILKIKLSTKSVKLLNVYQREGVIKLLLQDKNAKIIQQKYGISDFEMEDMEEQARYRRIPKGKRDIQAQIKQNSIIRIVVLYTKLGKNVEEISEQFNKDIDRIAEKHGKDREEIAPKLKREPKEVEEDIQRALSVGLIKEHELGGIDLLDTKLFQSKELVV